VYNFDSLSSSIIEAKICIFEVMEKEIDIRSKLSEVVHKTDPSAELYLFGSRARNTNRPDSDWDLLILVDAKEVTPEIEDKFRDKLYDIELETGQLISVFIYTNKFWKEVLQYSPLYENILKEGERL
jgi:uncharacterized protein